MRISILLSVVLSLCLPLPTSAQEAAAPAKKADAEEDKPSEPAAPKKKGKEGFQAVPEKKDAKPAARAVVTGRAAVVRAHAVANEKALIAQNKAQIQQWQQQLQPLLVSELNFVRQACEIPVEHRPKIRAVGEKSLEAAAERMVQEQQGGRAAEPVPISQSIQTDLGKALEAALPAEQFARYQQELQARARQRKRAIILSTVAKLEEALSLDIDQRQKIMESLESNWREPWENWLAVARYGDQYFPLVPDEVLTPHLQEAQRLLWNDVQKISLTSYNGVMNQPNDDLDWWGKNEKKAPPVDPPGYDVAPAVEAVDEAGALGEVFLKVLGGLFQAGAKKQ